MNINVFETTKKEETGDSGDISAFANDEVLQIRQKIENRKSKQKRARTIFGVCVIIILLLAASTAYSQYRLYILSKDEMIVGADTSKNEANAPQTPKTGEDVIKSLSRHILLPQGNPQIAEVKDAIKLRDSQAFFKDTQNGDVVVVYDTSIFIYRPSADIVVAAGDISGVGQVKP